MNDDALATYLEALSRDSDYRCAQVLKTSSHETTEVVYFTGSSGGELGPFIRKYFNGEAGLGNAYKELFQAQQSGRRFRHLPRIYDVHERDEDLVVIMEYVEGRTLHDEVYACDPSLDLAMRLFPALCDGVTEMHEALPQPLIHRDLKPSNVIVSPQGLTIIDFGIARTYRTDATMDTRQFGTKAYAPPEQFGYGQTDERSDIYALGMILYYLLREENPDASLASQGFPALAAMPEIRAVLEKATAFDPAARYQSVAALKAAFIKAAAVENAKAQRALEASSSQAMTAKKPPSSSEVFGMVWNVIVALIWLFFMAVLVLATTEPTDTTIIYPMVLRLSVYLGACGLFITGVAYGLMDKRWLRRLIPGLKNQTFGKSWVPAGILMIVGIVLLLVIAVICAIFYPTR